MRKCAPSHGSPSGSVTVTGAAARRARCAAPATQRCSDATRGSRRRRSAAPRPPSARSPRRSAREARAARRRTASASRRPSCRRGLLSRTPRPPPVLAAPSPISSMPAASSAATSFISESTLPRIDAVARLHALDGRHRQARQLGQLALVDAEQRPRGAQLGGSDHVFYIKIDVWNVYNCCCGMRTTIHCKLQTKILPKNDPVLRPQPTAYVVHARTCDGVTDKPARVA